ncbi:hypothetical protein BC826DRAFT_923304 [Russula brevipes]|nr:hypothetical protein BC826DRAFT_923304 [Russula brevipes]
MSTHRHIPFFKKAAYLLKRRSATTDFQWVKGHSKSKGNRESDRLARDGANKPEPDHLGLTIPATFDLQGAKPAMLTQPKAYLGTREQRKTPPCPAPPRSPL